MLSINQHRGGQLSYVAVVRGRGRCPFSVRRYRWTDRQMNITVASPRYAKHRAVKTIAHVAIKERMGLKLFGREIIFEEFQPM